EDVRDAVGMKLLDLRRQDGPAAAAVDAYVRSAALAQPIDEVLEEFDVPALIRRDRDGVRVLLDRRFDDLVDRAVVAEVDDLGAVRLEDAAHDVDRGIVAVEQR